MNGKHKESGFILITSYLIIAVLEIFSMAIFARNQVFIDASERNKNKMVAFNMAEAGIDDAIRRLENGTISSFPWTGTFTSLEAANTQGGYVITVTNDDGVYAISSTGFSPDNSSSSVIRESRNIQSYVSGSGDFASGVFAKNSIAMSGNAVTDSYNSDNGAYGGSNKGTNGDVGTDSASAGTVTMSGNVTVKGDVTVGPGGNPNTVVVTSGNSTITGTKSAASSTMNYTNATTTLSSSGALSISGNTNYVLPAGSYKFDSLSVTGNGTLTTSGPVTIYVSGTVNIAGNGISTASNKPPNLLLYSLGSSSVSLSGNGNFYGAIHAPNSAVSVTGNGSVYGAIISKTYAQSGNGNIHYDEALKEVGSSSGELTVRSWRETNTSS